MTIEDIRRARELLELATPAPWIYIGPDSEYSEDFPDATIGWVGDGIPTEVCDLAADEHTDPACDGEMIVWLRNNAEELLRRAEGTMEKKQDWWKQRAGE